MKIKERVYLQRYLQRFHRMFCSFINKPYTYIFIIPKFDEYAEAFEMYIEKFIRKYEIQEIILATNEKADIQVFDEIISVQYISMEECRAFLKLYELFPVCNNIMFIADEIKGRILPKDLTKSELVRLMLD